MFEPAVVIEKMRGCRREQVLVRKRPYMSSTGHACISSHMAQCVEYPSLFLVSFDRGLYDEAVDSTTMLFFQIVTKRESSGELFIISAAASQHIFACSLSTAALYTSAPASLSIKRQ
ncbi:hypothetical protein Barb7_00423 [Bacteroidales bacterium Barb7]|nr:hypothetical protein Barb7_00423 [Bacteroidales bacterium Barb7]